MITSLIISETQQLSFGNFIWNDPQNRKYLLLGIGISIVEFIVFKLLYPYPDFFSDSYSYLFAAATHLDISIWPIGYSKFLSAFHEITSSDTALVGFQYFLLQISALILFFTLDYFYQLQNKSKQLLFLFIIINPLSLYLCNTINSDALFAALSIFWIAHLVWLLNIPTILNLFIHAVLLFLCFTIRNNAYYYPVVYVILLLLINKSILFKISGLIIPTVLLVSFIIHTQNEAYNLTGKRQFSLFSGWQLANNALYIYDKIQVDSSTLNTESSKELNRISENWIHKVNPTLYRDFLESYVGNFFIRQPDAPLKTYYKLHYQNQENIISSWGKASIVFESFGKAIILNHPWEYFRYFVIPNAVHYYIPPLSHIGLYNYGQDNIDPIAKEWFHYRKANVRAFSYTLQGILAIYSGIFLLLNVSYLSYFGIYLIKRNKIAKTLEKELLLYLATIFVVCNYVFSLIATVNILRYQIVPQFVLLFFSVFLSEYIQSNSKHFKKQISK